MYARTSQSTHVQFRLQIHKRSFEFASIVVNTSRPPDCPTVTKSVHIPSSQLDSLIDSDAQSRSNGTNVHDNLSHMYASHSTFMSVVQHCVSMPTQC